MTKKYIIIVTRVHAGETPASYMLKGILDFIMEQSSDSKNFLENFVLVIIPMMNPDGVYRGNYRLDSQGYDLNRQYNHAFT